MAPFDVAVIGGGPAGATAARILAGGGARVCLLDKARFPRPKACGGALSPRTLRFLPAGVDRLIRTRIQGETALHIERTDSKFVVRASRSRLTIPAVIGADGVNGITARLLFPGRLPARYAASR